MTPGWRGPPRLQLHRATHCPRSIRLNVLNRPWSWTSGGPESGIPFGPLRFRAWTSAPATTAPGQTCIPFGPLRFRAWTNGEDVIVVPPVDQGGGGFVRHRPFTINLDGHRNRLLRDDELILFIAAASVAGDLLD